MSESTDIYHQYIVQLLSQNLNNQRNSGRNCDFKIIANDGMSFPVHKNVLEATCEWFNAFFKYENTDEVIIEITSANILSKILNYLYIGETTVSPEINEIKELLQSALYLCLPQLVDPCITMLCHLVNLNTFYDLLKYSETYDLGGKLKRKCLNYVLDNIQLFREMHLLELLSSDHMITLLSMERKNINHSEEFLLLKVQDWILFNVQERQKFMPELFNKINFGWLRDEFFSNKIFNDDNPFNNNLEFLKIFGGNKDLFLSSCLQSVSQPNLYGVIERGIFKFDWDRKNFVDRIADTQRFAGAFTMFGSDNIFACGGEIGLDVVNSCEYFSVNNNTWYDLPAMNKARFYHKVVTLHDKIYVCGGDDLNSMEIFDINTNSWQIASSLKIRDSFGFCTNNDCIYAVNEDNFERFDPREGKWTSLPSNGANISTAVGYDNFIYSFSDDFAYKFDIRINKWSGKTSHLEKFYESCQACLINSKIYVFGRAEDPNEDEHFLLEVYNASDLTNNNSFSLNMTYAVLKIYYFSLVFNQ